MTSLTSPTGSLCTLVWSKRKGGIHSSSGEIPIDRASGKDSIALRLEECDHVVICRATPVTASGTRGVTVIAESTQVEVAAPRAKDVSISGKQGNAKPGEPFTCTYTYRGGHEGESQIAWLRVPRSSLEGTLGTPILDANRTAYTPTADDEGHSLRVQVTPIRRDGVKGD